MTTVGQANLGDGPDHKKVALLDRLAHHGAQVIGLQEAGDRTAMLAKWCHGTGWRIWLGDADGSTSTPILWNPKAVDVSHQGTRPATPPTYTGKLGAGPSRVKAKVWNHVRVTPKQGEPFVFINGHLPASLYLPRRRALAKKQIAVLVDMVKRRRDRIAVVAVGDFNCLPNASVVKPLKKLGMKQRTKGGTKGRRCIDHTWTLDVSGKAQLLDVPSDHKSVLLTLKENR